MRPAVSRLFDGQIRIRVVTHFAKPKPSTRPGILMSMSIAVHFLVLRNPTPGQRSSLGLPLSGHASVFRTWRWRSRRCPQLRAPLPAHWRIAGDDHQHVLEVVGDATGRLADRLEPLGPNHCSLACSAPARDSATFVCSVSRELGIAGLDWCKALVPGLSIVDAASDMSLQHEPALQLHISSACQDESIGASAPVAQRQLRSGRSDFAADSLAAPRRAGMIVTTSTWCGLLQRRPVTGWKSPFDGLAEAALRF